MFQYRDGKLTALLSLQSSHSGYCLSSLGPGGVFAWHSFHGNESQGDNIEKDGLQNHLRAGGNELSFYKLPRNKIYQVDYSVMNCSALWPGVLYKLLLAKNSLLTCLGPGKSNCTGRGRIWSYKRGDSFQAWAISFALNITAINCRAFVESPICQHLNPHQLPKKTTVTGANWWL